MLVIRPPYCNVYSTLRAKVLKEHAKALLKKKGTTFGDFILTEFEDPVLREHVISISVTDIPKEVQVRMENFKLSLAMLMYIFSVLCSWLTLQQCRCWYMCFNSMMMGLLQRSWRKRAMSLLPTTGCYPLVS